MAPRKHWPATHHASLHYAPQNGYHHHIFFPQFLKGHSTIIFNSLSLPHLFLSSFFLSNLLNFFSFAAFQENINHLFCSPKPGPPPFSWKPLLHTQIPLTCPSPPLGFIGYPCTLISCAAYHPAKKNTINKHQFSQIIFYFNKYHYNSFNIYISIIN